MLEIKLKYGGKERDKLVIYPIFKYTLSPSLSLVVSGERERERERERENY